MFKKSEKAKAMVNKYSTSNAFKYILQPVINVVIECPLIWLYFLLEKGHYDSFHAFAIIRFYWAVVNCKEFGCKHETNRNALF